MTLNQIYSHFKTLSNPQKVQFLINLSNNPFTTYKLNYPNLISLYS